MSGRRFTDASRLLDDLLTRRESRPTAERLLAYVDEAGFTTVGEQDLFVAALEDMAARGAVELNHRRVDGLTRLVSVRLKDADSAYAWLGRTPSAVAARTALSKMLDTDGGSPVRRSIAEEVLAGWSRNVRVFGLKKGQGETLRKAMLLAEALVRRVEAPDAAQVDVRSFARETCGDSKALRDHASTVLALLRRLRPDLEAPTGIEPADAFASWGVVAMPHPLLLSGRVGLDDVAMPPVDFFGLPPEEAGRLTLQARPAYVLTIENQASFVRHAREVNREGRGLILYTGGFPSRAVLSAIIDLVERAKAPVFHWGDLDAGGVRIFLHLEAALGARGIDLKPHLMEPDRLKLNGSPAGPIRSIHTPDGSAVSVLSALVTGPGALSLEQEAVAPSAPSLP